MVFCLMHVFIKINIYCIFEDSAVFKLQFLIGLIVV